VRLRPDDEASLAPVTPALAEIRGRYRVALAAHAGIDPGMFDRPGSTIAPVEDRTGTGTASAYRVGVRTLVYCDPEVADRVSSLADADTTVEVTMLSAWAGTHGADFIGGAWHHLAGREMLADTATPDGATMSVLDRDRDHGLIAGLVARCDPNDVEEAEVELDNLDPVIVGLLDGTGRIGAYAGEHPWELDAGFADIGVLTRPDLRRIGWGSAAVAALCRLTFEQGRLPLYRCNWDRAGSRRLALALGFVEVASLAAVRFVDR
jgi:hypothetical protein